MRLFPLLSTAAASILLPLASLAEVPRVVTDIGPVAGLAGGIMAGLGTPAVLVPTGGDPHHFQLRPSQARDLAAAGAVIWIGPGLTPWLERLIAATAPGALSVELEEAPGLTRRAPMFVAEALHDDRDGAEEAAEPHDAAADHGAEDGHEHDPEEGHEDGAGHDDHDDAHEAGQDDHNGHDHGGEDPHIWLDPANARAMTAEIAARLSALDPENAASYGANAAKVQAALDAAEAEARALLAPHRGARLVVFHDGYAHFAAAFGVNIVAALADGEAASPGAAAMQALREQIAASGADCLFAESQHPAALVQSLATDTGVGLGTLDPLAGADAPGAVWVALAHSIDRCLTGG